MIDRLFTALERLAHAYLTWLDTRRYARWTDEQARWDAYQDTRPGNDWDEEIPF